MITKDDLIYLGTLFRRKDLAGSRRLPVLLSRFMVCLAASVTEVKVFLMGFGSKGSEAFSLTSDLQTICPVRGLK